MIVRIITCLALISALALTSAEKLRYDGYHVISVNVENEKQREFLEQFDASSDEVQLLEMAMVNQKASLVVAPYKLAEIESMLSEEGLVPQVETTNLQKYDKACGYRKSLSSTFGFSQNFRRRTTGSYSTAIRMDCLL